MKKFATLATTIVMATAVFAAEHQVEMVNSGKDGFMAFEPGFIQAAKGDTVKFIKTDPSHNSSTFFAPKGAFAWKGKMDGEIVVKLDVEASTCTSVTRTNRWPWSA